MANPTYIYNVFYWKRPVESAIDFGDNIYKLVATFSSQAKAKKYIGSVFIQYGTVHAEKLDHGYSICRMQVDENLR